MNGSPTRAFFGGKNPHLSYLSSRTVVLLSNTPNWAPSFRLVPRL